MTERTTLEIIAPTVEEALAQGLAQLALPADAVSVEVLDSGTKGLFGLGGRQVRVRLTVNPPGESPAPKSTSASRPEPPGQKRGRKTGAHRLSETVPAPDSLRTPAEHRQTPAPEAVRQAQSGASQDKS